MPDSEEEDEAPASSEEEDPSSGDLLHKDLEELSS